FAQLYSSQTQTYYYIIKHTPKLGICFIYSALFFDFIAKKNAALSAAFCCIELEIFYGDPEILRD
ncbi:MAG: hypothetical protein VX772_02175, partial [Bacteroidota bacterium]|nr:hypothetical protein [Bacteroidota bacterium]